MTNRKSYRAIEPPDIIVCVEWIDASTQKGPVNRNELAGVFKLTTVGWLVRENKEHITVCMDYVPENDEFRDVQHILKVNVVSRKEWKWDRAK